MQVENQTPFQVIWAVLLDKQGAECMTVTVKATYDISPDGHLTLAPLQEQVRGTEQFHGEPGKSSISFESELGPGKVATDVALVGCAVAPARTTRGMDLLFRVGGLRKRLRVYGNRHWQGALGLYSASEPEPFERIPLVYENAFGGSDLSAKNPRDHDQEPRNPVGRGFLAKRSEMTISGMALPNIEDPDEPLNRPGQRVRPQGFGFIARNWQPRLGYAGTYDQQWMQERRPLLPLDFDDRYHNASHPDLTAKGFLGGDEPVEIVGCTPGGSLSFTLPGARPQATVIGGRGSEPVALNLNTVLVNTETLKTYLVWKGNLNIHRRLLTLTALRCALGR